jgi:hypothetical protein
MVKLKQGILGGISGKVGNVVGSSWKGISVVKAMPLSVANPRTEAQTEQRSALAIAVKVAVAILADVIKPHNDRFARKMSGYNLFMSRNVEEFKEIQIPAKKVKMQLSRGKLGNTANFRLAGHSSASLRFEWDTAFNNKYQSADDIVYLVIYDINQDRLHYNAGVVKRSQGFAIISSSLPGLDSADWNCCLSFASPDGKNVSNTDFYYASI